MTITGEALTITLQLPRETAVKDGLATKIPGIDAYVLTESGLDLKQLISLIG